MSLKVGNVPEHFSSPLHIGVERGIFKKHLVEVEPVNCPGGTGEMVKMLQSKEIDLAIALTEGLISAIAKGAEGISIIGTYVDAPLTWAISAGIQSPHQNVDSLKQGTIGVSRLGSGSHIMSYVLADQMGWLSSSSSSSSSSQDDQERKREETEGKLDEKGPFQFSVLKDFKGLRDGVNSGVADAFMWEQFTTKPFYDKSEVKRIGHITTPWPAFLIAVRTELLDQDPEVIKRLLVGLTESASLFMKEKETGGSVTYVSNTYKQKVEDVQAWFKTVRFAKDCACVERDVLLNCVSILIKAGVLKSPVPPESLVDLRVSKLV